MNEEKPSKKMEAVELGKLKDKSKSNTVVTIFIVILLFLTVIALPYVTDYINERKNEDKTRPVAEEKNPKKDSDEDSEEDDIHEISDNLVISYDKLSFSKINIIDSVLSFNVLNDGNNINFKNNKLFIELYSENNTLVDRVRIFSNELLAQETRVFNIPVLINSETIKFIKIVKYEISDYPALELSTDTEGIQQLICIKDNTTIKYEFMDNKLSKIIDQLTYEANEDLTLYSETLNEYKLKEAQMNRINGYIATVVDNGSTFIYTLNIDLSVVDLKNSDKQLYYKKNTEPKEIKFEVEASGYNCN